MDRLNTLQVRQINYDERKTNLDIAKKLLLEMRIKQATRQKIKTHTIKQNKKQVARIITINRENN